MRLAKHLNLSLSAFALLAFAGCGGDKPAPAQPNPPAAVAPAEGAAKPAAAQAPAAGAVKTVSLNSEEKAEIAKLTDKADQDAATAQGKCPVSGENLGSMGVPIKLTAEGKSLYVCCKGCTKDFEKDPKGVFAKLGK